MIDAIARIAVHTLLFVLAVVVFYLGLGVGLAFNPTLGTLLWVVATGLGRGESVLDLPVAPLTGRQLTTSASIPTSDSVRDFEVGAIYRPQWIQGVRPTFCHGHPARLATVRRWYLFQCTVVGLF